MKEIIIPALEKAADILDKITPKVKKIKKMKSIIDVHPLRLTKFMEDNNIPSNASFDGRDNGYDAWDDIVLSWEIEVPNNVSDRINYKKKRFESIAYRHVMNAMKENGYTRRPLSKNSIADFNKTVVYDLYTNQEIDKLVEYYTNIFEKK